MLRSRQGLFFPGSVRVPRYSRISSALRSVHVGLAGPDELDGKIEELFEIIRGIVQAVIPVESHPADIIHDGVHVLHLLFGGVGVVEAQVAGAVVGLGDPEVQADGFGVADVQVAVGFRGKPGGQGVKATSARRPSTGSGAVKRPEPCSSTIPVARIP
jgi:hypothetical protein